MLPYRAGLLVAVIVASFGAWLVWLALAGGARWRGLEVSRSVLAVTGLAIVAVSALYLAFVYPRLQLLH
jgi:hypothetical protein